MNSLYLPCANLSLPTCPLAFSTPEASLREYGPRRCNNRLHTITITSQSVKGYFHSRGCRQRKPRLFSNAVRSVLKNIPYIFAYRLSPHAMRFSKLIMQPRARKSKSPTASAIPRSSLVLLFVVTTSDPTSVQSSERESNYLITIADLRRVIILELL